MIGKTVLHYRILEKIGEGGMGVVYKAEDTKLKRTVALKFLPPEMMRDKEAKDRFIQEAQAAAALNHPNICIVYEIEKENGQYFIAMEYIEGLSLKEKMASGPLAVGEALDVAGQVAEGLEEAHRNGIIHRDIKPANVMLTKRRQTKIMAFGLAKLEWGIDLTKTATIMGTVAYMSPEQARGEKVDLRTDIWSLGCVLYEMLTAKRPFKSTNDQAALYSILNEKPVPMTEFRMDITRKLERVVEKCLEKDTRKRYKDMSALLDDLKSIVVKPKLPVSEKPSIAVLPFVNMSADPENEYFSDGLAEDLINSLTKITDLHVVARTSSFAFKGAKIDIREIGRKLNVDNLLEGSVRKVGSRVRITAQLIKVQDGYHLWSDRYDRNMEDVFAIQDEITEKIMEKLMVALDMPSKPPKEHRPVNLEAYELYLKGRYCLNMFAMDKALAYYNQAIEKDPDYALAYASVAEVYTLLSTGFDILPGKDAMPKAREAAQKALELDPNSASAHQWIEFYWTYMEADLDTATAHLERAQELDPLNFLIKVRLGFMSIFKRGCDHALDHFKALLDFEPNFALLYLSFMTAYALKGMYDEALSYGEKMLESSPPAGAYIGNLGWLYALAGKKEKAYQLLADLEERSKKGYVSSFWTAIIYLGLEEIDKVFEWLEKAYEEHDGNMIYFTVPQIFDPIRSDPRYQQLLKKMGLGHLIAKLCVIRK